MNAHQDGRIVRDNICQLQVLNFTILGRLDLRHSICAVRLPVGHAICLDTRAPDADDAVRRDASDFLDGFDCVMLRFT